MDARILEHSGGHGDASNKLGWLYSCQANLLLVAINVAHAPAACIICS